MSKVEFSDIFPAGVQLRKSGDVGLANESAFANSFLSTPLTTYVAGTTATAEIEAVLDFVAPPVIAGRRFEYQVAKASQKLAAELNDSDIRAIGSEFKMIDAVGQIELGKTKNKGLTMRIDRDISNENAMAKEEAVIALRRRLIVMEIARAFKLFEANASAKTATWSAAVSTVWADPDSDLMGYLATDDKNVSPNRLLFGRTALSNRFKALRSGTDGKAATSMFTLEQLASLLGVSQILTNSEIYYSSSSVSAPIVPKTKVYGFYAQDGATRYDPSNLKRFITPGAGGGKFEVFIKEEAAFEEVTVSHYSDIVCTDASGMFKLTVS